MTLNQADIIKPMLHLASEGPGCIARLLLITGLALLVVGGFALYPSVREAVEPQPSDFGETTLPLAAPPLATLPPQSSQAAPIPEQLPDTSLARLPAAQPYSSVPAASVSTTITIQSPKRIIISAIDLNAPIERVGWQMIEGVSQWDVPDHFAAGWLQTSAPLGQPGNTVLDGHHNLAGEVFKRLADLKLGDEIEVDSDSHVFFYKVTAREVLLERDQPREVRLKNARWIQPTTDERLTLVTCWPYTSNTHRLIIVAQPIDPNGNDLK